MTKLDKINVLETTTPPGTIIMDDVTGDVYIVLRVFRRPPAAELCVSVYKYYCYSGYWYFTEYSSLKGRIDNNLMFGDERVICQ
jgi:hypothetical protein